MVFSMLRELSHEIGIGCYQTFSPHVATFFRFDIVTGNRPRVLQRIVQVRSLADSSSWSVH
jgi:hypothetical protein